MKKVVFSLLFVMSLSLAVSPVHAAMGQWSTDDGETREISAQSVEKEDSPAIKMMIAVAHIGGILTWIALMAFLSTGTLFFYRELKRKK